MKFFRITQVIFIGLVIAGCANKYTVINGNYDFNKMNRIGVSKFRAPKNVRGIEDLFCKELLANGFDVVDKNSIRQIFKRNEIPRRDYVAFKKANDAMGSIKIDVLLTGEISYYKPAKEVVKMVETQDISIDDRVFNIHFKRDSDGSERTEIEKDAQKIKTEKTLTPMTYETDTSMGVIVKIMDMETLDIIWIGYVTKSGESILDAEAKAVKYLVKRLKKDIKSVFKK